MSDAEELHRLRAENERLRKALGPAQWALQPFSDRVFNDNGDCTVTDTHVLSAQRFIDAHFAYKRIRAALEGKG